MKSFFSLTLITALALPILAAEPTLKTSKTLPACCSKEGLKPGTFTDQSLYQLDSMWTDDRGKTAKLDQLAGKPQVVTMFFASCIYACPILAHDLKKIEAALPAHLRGKVGFTLVSFDSERDTTKVLADFRKSHKLPSDWTLLRGKSDDVLELGALLGIKFKKETNGQFAHSNVITVLDGKGEIIFQKAGLNTDPTETVKSIEKAVETCKVQGES